MSKIMSMNDYCIKQYGEKLYKLSLDGGMTCPNRDGTKGSRGCIFCSEGGSGEFAAKRGKSLEEQIEEAKSRISKKFRGSHYIAYFQAFTNTYAPISYLRELFLGVLRFEEIKVIDIATRPDCLSEEVLDFLKELNEKIPVWVELGLQTTKEESIEYIRRGYDTSVYDDAVNALNRIGIHTITHVILGLPNESISDMVETVRHVVSVGSGGIKLQLLHVLKGTDLEKDYERGEFDVMSMEEYLDALECCIKEIPENMVVHRLTGDGPKNLLVAPTWSGDKKRVLNKINARLKNCLSVLLIFILAICLSSNAYAKNGKLYNRGEGETGIEENEGVSDNDIQEPVKIKVNAVKNIRTTGISRTKCLLEWDESKEANCYEIYEKVGNSDYRLIDIIEEASLTIKVKENTTYHFKIVAKYVSEDETEYCSKGKSISYKNKSIVSLDKQVYSYATFVSNMKALKKKYNNYISYETIGTSVEGRTIYDIIIGNRDAKNSVLVVCEIHGREYVTSIMAMKQIEYYLQNYNKKIGGKKPASVFEKTAVYYIVMANPDGAQMSQNVRATWKANANGVNLNRNFDFNFKIAGHTFNGTFSGKKVESEPEASAMASLTRKLKKNGPLKVISYHSMGEIVFGSCPSNKSCYDMTKKMYHLARELTGYKDPGSYDSLAASYGCYREYCLYKLNVPCITLEVGHTFTPNKQSEYEEIFQKNKFVVLRIAAL